MLAKLGRGALVARLDLNSAFRLLPINPSDFDLLGFKVLDKIYIDMCQIPHDKLCQLKAELVSMLNKTR